MGRDGKATMTRRTIYSDLFIPATTLAERVEKPKTNGGDDSGTGEEIFKRKEINVTGFGPRGEVGEGGGNRMDVTATGPVCGYELTTFRIGNPEGVLAIFPNHKPAIGCQHLHINN